MTKTSPHMEYSEDDSMSIATTEVYISDRWPKRFLERRRKKRSLATIMQVRIIFREMESDQYAMPKLTALSLQKSAPGRVIATSKAIDMAESDRIRAVIRSDMKVPTYGRQPYTDREDTEAIVVAPDEAKSPQLQTPVNRSSQTSTFVHNSPQERPQPSS